MSHFDLKKIETRAELKFDPNFWVKMTHFFLLRALREKMSHFDLKNELLMEKS